MAQNFRGQLYSFVNESTREGEMREIEFLKYLKDIKGVSLVKKGKYKPYDFMIKDRKDVKIELKTINNHWNEYEYIYICIDKLIYYQYRLNKDPTLIFILIYAFFGPIDNPNKKIIYRYTTLNIYDFLYIYERTTYKNKKCVLIPKKLFKPLKSLINTIKNIKSDDTYNDFVRLLHYYEILEDISVI